MKRNVLIIFMILIVAGAICSCNVFNRSKSEKNVAGSSLKGKWELNYISGIKITFSGLYPNNKPEVTFDAAQNEIRGNTSCNGFISKATISGNKLTIAEPGPMTMRYCEGGGEKYFLDMLKKVTSYNVNDDTLTLIQGDIAVMRFTKK